MTSFRDEATEAIRDANGRVAHAFVDALFELGLRHAVIAPGSRCTPLVIALEDRGVRTHVVHDERSGAFLALGIGRATERPALVVTTSGTATANLYPALVEASADQVPLLAVTADRPLEVVGSGANQTIPQRDLFGEFVRRRFDLAAEPTVSERRVRARARDAFEGTLGADAGPVHVNLRFRKPLEIARRDPSRRSEAKPTRVQPTLEFDAPRGFAELRSLLENTVGLIVVGSLREESEIEAARRIVNQLGWPVHASITSGLRGRDVRAPAIHDIDPVLEAHSGENRFSSGPVLWLGGATVSTRLPEHLARQEVEIVRVGRRGGDGEDCATTVVRVSLLEFERAITQLQGIEIPSEIDDAMLTLRRTLRRAGELPIEARVACVVAESTQQSSHLFVANSAPIRDLDRFAPDVLEADRVFSNRGVSGIDGTLSTAMGIALGSGLPVTTLCGDLAFLHDAGSLSAFRQEVPLRIVVVDNHGGGLFHRLPIATHEEHRAVFERCIVTPHAVDLVGIARSYGVEARRVDTVEDLHEALRELPTRLEIFVIQTDAREEQRLRAQHEAACRAALAALRST